MWPRSSRPSPSLDGSRFVNRAHVSVVLPAACSSPANHQWLDVRTNSFEKIEKC
ncbi:hypothetical protein ACP70R_023379 [Stipagrostis hirtigluma subsp. patula]